MTKKDYTITLTEDLVVNKTRGTLNRNSNSTQRIAVELDGWKLAEGSALFIGLTHYDDDKELKTDIGPLQLFYNEKLDLYITDVPPEMICLPGEWNYSIELRFNFEDKTDSEGYDDELPSMSYDSITSAIYSLTVIDSIIKATKANDFVKEIELITAAKVIKENIDVANGNTEAIINATESAKRSAEAAAQSEKNAQDSAEQSAANALSARNSEEAASESEQRALKYANSAQFAEESALSAEQSAKIAQESAENASNEARNAKVSAAEAKDYAALAAAASSSGLRKVIVETLPEEGSDNYIYLVPSGSATADNYYDEFLWVKDEETGKGKYEKIGTTRTDFTADNIILEEDITLAGNYVQVGNISKGSENATATFSAKGKSVAQVLEEIFTKRLQPKIIALPQVSGFALQGAVSVEAGTKFNSFMFGTAVLSAGSYTYGPETGVIAEEYNVERICVPSELSSASVVTAASGSDDNDGNGFIIGDVGGENVVSSIKYKVTAAYNEGAVALDNLGGQSEPPLKIESGTAEQTTLAVTPYRNYFYGAVSDQSPLQGEEITSELVRGLRKSNREYSSGEITVNVPAGSTGVYIACIATRTGVTKVINETALNADVTATFVKQTGVMVEGADGYTAVQYNIWYYIPAVPYENNATLKITLG